MQRQDLDYSKMNIESRQFAGLDGFDITHTPDDGKPVTIATLYNTDTKLLHVIDSALEKHYGKDKKE